MVDETKPVVAEPVVAPATETVVPETKPVETPVSAVEEAPVATEDAPEVPPKDEAAVESKEEPKVDPIYRGTVKYITGKGLSTLLPKPVYEFFFHEDPVKAEDLKHTVKLHEAGGKETAAWSNETGEGLLFYRKEGANKSGPPGALLLHAVEELKAIGTEKLSFKLHGTTHNISTANKAERDGWMLSIQSGIDDAKALKEKITTSEGYKSVLEKLEKPAGLVAGTAAAAVVAKEVSEPKKSVDERKARPEAKKEAKAAKDRSQSRGKKFFDQIRGKKETKAEDATKSEEVAAEAEAVTEPTEVVEATEIAPLAPVEEPVVAAPALEESKAEEKIEEKKGRRSSKFFDKIKSFGSPTTEKKQEDIVPASEAAVADATPAVEPTTAEPVPEVIKAEEPIVAAEETPAVVGEAPVEESKSTEAAPAEKTERRRSLFDFSAFKNKSSKKEAVKDEVKAEETAEEVKPIEESKPVEPVSETPAVTEATETPVETKEPEVKKEKSSSGGIIGLIRSKSKALRSGPAKKEKAKTPEKVEESATEDAPVETVEEPVKPTEVTKKSETSPAIIGDVVPEAINVGAAPSAPAVAAH